MIQGIRQCMVGFVCFIMMATVAVVPASTAAQTTFKGIPKPTNSEAAELLKTIKAEYKGGKEGLRNEFSTKLRKLYPSYSGLGHNQLKKVRP